MAVISQFDFNSVKPAAPSNTVLALFQKEDDPDTETRFISMPVPYMTGDTGSGGTAGAVPPPPSGSAALGYVLGASGAFIPVANGVTTHFEPLVDGLMNLIFDGTGDLIMVGGVSNT